MAIRRANGPPPPPPPPPPLPSPPAPPLALSPSAAPLHAALRSPASDGESVRGGGSDASSEVGSPATPVGLWPLQGAEPVLMEPEGAMAAARAGQGVCLEPQLVLFEFVSGLMLRRQQVALMKHAIS